MHVNTMLGLSNKPCFYISCTWQGGGQKICYLNLSEPPAPPGPLYRWSLRQSDGGFTAPDLMNCPITT